MPKPISFGELDFNLVASMEEAQAVIQPDSPFQMMIMGDFSGRASRGSDAVAKVPTELRPLLVDRDNIEQVMKRLKVAIELPLLGPDSPPVRIEFSEIDDFHPDELYQRLEIFQALKETRKGLNDPRALAAFVKEMQSPAPDASFEKQPKERKPPEVVPAETGAALLDQILEQSVPDTPTTSAVKSSSSTRSELDSFLHSIVRPNLVEKDDPRREELLDAVDDAASELMGMIIHHGVFQSLEAAWRGLNFLVSRLETDGQLQLYLLDISKEEFSADLLATDELRRSALYKLLVEKGVGMVGGHPWSVVACNYSFNKEITDLELLGRAAKIGYAAGASFLAAADDTFLCANSLAETADPDDWQVDVRPQVEESWQSLRLLPEATNLGLALPRILLRLPYGAKTDPVDLFNFEEMSGGATHQNYLWGNPCFALLLLLGQAFSREGWQMRPGSVLEIDSLPLHLYKERGESLVKPCAEVMLSHRAAEYILDQGLMPLLSFHSQDKIRLGRFQCIGSPAARLAGSWS